MDNELNRHASLVAAREAAYAVYLSACDAVKAYRAPRPPNVPHTGPRPCPGCGVPVTPNLCRLRRRDYRCTACRTKYTKLQAARRLERQRIRAKLSDT